MVEAHPLLRENKGKVAVEKGPLLYCAEWPDNGGSVLNLLFEKDAKLMVKTSSLLGGIDLIEGQTRIASRSMDGSVTLSDPQTLTLIPYHLWNNRGPGEMSVWLPAEIASVSPSPAPSIVNGATITASLEARTFRALKDQQWPTHSADRKAAYIHWWPKKASTEWVQFDFDQPERVSRVELYWFDDGPDGGCRIPRGWEVQYRSGDSWLPVSALTPYSVTKDAPDRVQFSPVQTDAIRILIQLPEDFATGLYEVTIE